MLSSKTLKFSYILVALFFIAVVSPVLSADVTTVFTDFYLWKAAPDAAAPIQLLNNDAAFLAEVKTSAIEALRAVPALNLRVPEELAVAESTKRMVFVRGVLSRPGIEKITRRSRLVYRARAYVTFEFFDIVTGEVYHNITRRVIAFPESDIDAPKSDRELSEILRELINSGIRQTAAALGSSYDPDDVAGSVLDVLPDGLVVVDLGHEAGILQNSTLHLYLADGSQPIGILRTVDVQQKMSLATVTFSDNPVTAGQVVHALGVNKRIKHRSQTTYAVAGFTYADPTNTELSESIAPLELGQWLHDQLANESDLLLLAPMLVERNKEHVQQMHDAVMATQEEFSIGASRPFDEVAGHRALPDVLIMGVLTRADMVDMATSTTDGSVTRMNVAITVEFYDRRSRRYIFGVEASAVKSETIIPGFRELEKIDTSFERVCRSALNKAAIKIKQKWGDAPAQGVVEAIDGELIVVELAPGTGRTGDRLRVIRLGDEQVSNSGVNLGRIEIPLADIVLVTRISAEKYGAVVRVDLSTTDEPSVGDLVRGAVSSRSGQGDDIYQVVTADDVADSTARAWGMSSIQIVEWTHAKFLELGTLELVPPATRDSNRDAVELAMRFGDFALAVESAGEEFPEDPFPTATISCRRMLAVVDSSAVIAGMFYDVANEWRLELETNDDCVRAVGAVSSTEKNLKKRFTQVRDGAGLARGGPRDLWQMLPAVDKASVSRAVRNYLKGDWEKCRD